MACSVPLLAPLALLLAAASPPLAAQTLARPFPEPPLGFGAAVAAAGGTVFVGRPGLVSGFPMPAMERGAIHLFRAGPDGRWREVGQVTARETVVGDGFGLALATDGSTLVVGAPNAAESRGAAWVFERSAQGSWVERARLTAADGVAGDLLGTAVALDGRTILVGVPGRDSSRGQVRVYGRDPAGAWREQGRLPIAVAPGDRFGAALALAGGTAIVGIPGPSGGGFLGGGASPRAGGALAFRRGPQGDWVADGRLEPDSGVMTLGAAVLLDGTDAFVGAPLTGGAAGAVFAYRREGDGAWRRVERIEPAAPARPAFLGAALARDGGDLLAGAPFAGGAGSVLVFRRGGDGRWQEAQRLSVPATGLGTGFGSALAAGGGVAAVGAPGADFFEGAGQLYRRAAPGGEWTALARVVDSNPGLPVVTGREIRCDSSAVRGFPCSNVDLVSFIPVSQLGGKRGIMLNDIWGWTDPETGREFALVGRLDGTAFVEVTDPANPRYLGELPLHAGAQPNLWRDIKVYKNHAYIVSDGAGPHGMQVFDLTQLRRVSGAPVGFSETAHYDRIHSAHNIVIDTTAGFAYAVGASMGGQTCGGALHMIDIRDPARPTFAGCYADPATGRSRTGYTHDAQCVVYQGPDARYTGRQICFNASETALGIADVTDKTQPKALASASYPNVGYSHQGWLSEDQRYFFLDDELDELAGTAPTTRTVVWDVSNLEDPVVATEFLGTTPASDHNQYVRGRYLYQSNYVAGLRVLDIQDPRNPREVGYFDTVPVGANAAGFAGSWSNYPFFRSGVVAVTSMREGFFMVRFRPRPPIP